MKKETTKRGANQVNQLPPHAYHPNISLRLSKRTGYIARPESNK